MTKTNRVVASKSRSSKGILSWQEKMLISGLLLLEIPFAIVLFPLAAICVLTGILAPLGIMSFRVATMPLSWAMKLRTAWQSGSEPPNTD